jgi:hypothetical protein
LAIGASRFAGTHQNAGQLSCLGPKPLCLGSCGSLNYLPEKSSVWTEFIALASKLRTQPINSADNKNNQQSHQRALAKLCEFEPFCAVGALTESGI